MTRFLNSQGILTPIALGSLIAGALIAPSHAILSSYKNPGNGAWTFVLNWTNGVPRNPGDIAFVGSSVAAKNSNLTVNTDLSIDGLLISDGMHVDTNGRTVRILEPIPAAGLKIIGANRVGDTLRHSQLIVRPLATEDIYFADMYFKDASLEGGGRLVLDEGAVWATGSLDIDPESSITGSGSIFFNSHDHFDNNGTIAPTAGGKISIHAPEADFDLKLGGSNHTGNLSAMAPGSRIYLGYKPLFLIFEGNLEIGPGSQIQFENDLDLGVGTPGSLTMSSTTFQTAVLKVGKGGKMLVGAGSEINTSGNCLIDGGLSMAGSGTTLTVAEENASRLTINGNTRILGGTVTAAGHLYFQGGISESSHTTFLLEGGEIEAPDGTMITLTGPDANDYLKGHGLWNAGINNETRIQANGGILTVDTTNSPANWDGTTDKGRLDARNGSLHLIQPFGIATFKSYAVVGNGNTLTLDAPTWDFPPESQIILGGDADLGGTVTATGVLDLYGKVTVSKPSSFASPTNFYSTTRINFEDSELRLSGGEFQIQQGATLQGTGMLKVSSGSSLNFDLTNQIETGLTNDGTLTVNGNSSGILTIDGPFLPTGDKGTGRVVFDIKSRPVGSNFDRIQVNNSADLRGGILKVNFNVVNAQPGDVWKIIAADSVSGIFENYEFNGLPIGMGLRTLIAEDGVYLKLVPKSLNYLEWANQQGLLLPDLAMDADPDGDDIGNIAEFYYGGSPLKPSHDLKPVVGLKTIDGKRYLTLTVLQAVHSEIGNGIVLQVQESFGLENWIHAQAVLMSTVYDPGHCRNILTFRSKTPITDHQRQFLRAAFYIL